MKQETELKQDVLSKIGRTVQARIDQTKINDPLEALRSRIDRCARQPFDFMKLFSTPAYEFSIIAEIKKASPSRGDIAPNLDHLEVADQYLSNQATALSILTEESYFKGNISFIRDIRNRFPEAKILMKDFFVDEYQVYQALDVGADAILVIVALLGEQKSERFLKLAQSLGLSVLVEVHTSEELEIANRIGAKLVGINSRNLKDLSISLERITNLIPKVASGSFVIGESGISSHRDLATLKQAGCHGFLVGTNLMSTGKPGEALKKLMSTDER